MAASSPPVAIMSAMHEELSAVLKLMPDEHKSVAAGREFWRGHLHGHEVVAVLSRIGKVAAATTATVLIERFGVKQIFFTGVAGGLASGVNVGDIVVGRSFMQHDMDASPIFPRHEVPLYGRSRFDADAALSDVLLGAVNAIATHTGGILSAEASIEFGIDKPEVHEGLIVSGDRFVSTTAECNVLRNELPDALAVEMECAAVAQVCLDYGVEFAAVRTISDRADDAAHVDFTRFIGEVASVYSMRIVDEFFRRLKVS